MKQIPGFPGYMADRLGNVYSLKNGRHGLRRKRKRLLPILQNNGYVTVCLCRDKKIVRRLVHNVILETFVGPRPPGMYGCHKTNNRLNNSLKNLCWQTPSQNQADRVKDGTDCRGSKSRNAKLTESDVIKIRELRGKMKLSKIGKLFGISEGTASAIQMRKRWAWL